MKYVQPKTLSGLFSIFDMLNAANQSVGLGSADCGVPPPSSASECFLGVFSSGTSGPPKQVWHSWPELLHAASSSPKLRRWGSPFSPQTFAGVQVALHAWIVGAEVVSLPYNPVKGLSLLREGHIQALCCTPTYADLLAQEAESDRRSSPPKSLQQITLGGEVLRSRTGRRLDQAFPMARKTVVYATSELGVIMRTHRLDGWYESQSLQKYHQQWRISRGVLEIQRHGRWNVTGDRAELGVLQDNEVATVPAKAQWTNTQILNPLIRITGRADAIANVAGTKVNLDDIANAAEDVRGVRRALAVKQSNTIAGEIVCLRFAVERGCEPADVQKVLETALRSRLPRAAWPRRWELDCVADLHNGKRNASA